MSCVVQVAEAHKAGKYQLLVEKKKTETCRRLGRPLSLIAVVAACFYCQKLYITSGESIVRLVILFSSIVVTSFLR